MELEIPVPAFLEAGVYDIHSDRYTGARLFHHQPCRNDRLYIQACGKNIYGKLMRCVPGRLIDLFKIPSADMQQDTVYRLTGVQFMSLVDSGQPSDVPGLRTVLL